MHPSSMDWERYKYIFLKTSDEYVNCLGGASDLMLYSRKEPERIFFSHPDFSKPADGWSTLPAEMLNGKPAIHFAGNEFGLSLEVPSETVWNKGKFLFTKITLTRFDVKKKSSAAALFVNDVLSDTREHESYYSFALNNIPSERDSDLHTFHSEFNTTNIKDKNSKMFFYIWNKEHGDFYITDISIEIFRVFL